MTRSRYDAEDRLQAAISPRVRAQPVQKVDEASSRQTPMQGETKGKTFPPGRAVVESAADS